ncbi:MAG: Flp family type IVb pilin [Proteobacteria bacterium]|nr:Flp family type IVb pilin [Pseudomonadota bacterium]
MFRNKFNELLSDESGATTIEYGLIAALVSVAAVGALSTMGESLTGIFTAVSDQLGSAVTGATGEGGEAGTGEGT